MDKNPFDDPDFGADQGGQSSNKPANVFDDENYGKKPGLVRSVADSATSFAENALVGAQLVTNIAGADNPVSRGLGKAAETVRGFESAGRRAEREARANRIREAEASGSTWEEIKANVGAFTEAPIDTTLGAVATSLPSLAATALTRGRARLAAGAGMGAAQGAGAVKGGIYDAVEQAHIEDGATPEEAAARASEAQSYRSDNAGQIGLGAGLGFVAGSTGIERAVGRMVGQEAGERGARGLARTVATGVLGEAPVEGLQGGQERLASNIALQNEGFDTPTWQGVAGSAALEGVAGGAAGGGFGAIEGFMNRQPAVDPLADHTADDPMAGAGEPEPEVPPAAPGMAPGQVPEQYRRETLGADPAQPAVETPVAEPVRAPTPSEQMGIDPNAGPLSAAASIAVDTGTTEQLAQQAALQQAAEAAEQAQKRGGKQEQARVPEGVDPQTGEVLQQGSLLDGDPVAQMQSRLDYLQQQARRTGWNKQLVRERDQIQARLQELGVQPEPREQVQARAEEVAAQTLAGGGTEADATRAATDTLIDGMAAAPDIEIARDAPAAVSAAKARRDESRPEGSEKDQRPVSIAPPVQVSEDTPPSKERNRAERIRKLQDQGFEVANETHNTYEGAVGRASQLNSAKDGHAYFARQVGFGTKDGGDYIVLRTPVEGGFKQGSEVDKFEEGQRWMTPSGQIITVSRTEDSSKPGMARDAMRDRQRGTFKINGKDETYLLTAMDNYLLLGSNTKQSAVAGDAVAQEPQAAADIKAITSKQIPQMTDAEIEQAIAFYGPDHKRTTKLLKEQQKRDQPTTQRQETATRVQETPEAQQAGAQRTEATGEAAARAAVAQPAVQADADAGARWESLSPEEKARILTRPGGWATAKGGLNVIGKRLAKSDWASMPTKTRETVARLMEKAGVTAPTAASLPSSTAQAGEKAPQVADPRNDIADETPVVIINKRTGQAVDIGIYRGTDARTGSARVEVAPGEISFRHPDAYEIRPMSGDGRSQAPAEKSEPTVKAKRGRAGAAALKKLAEAAGLPLDDTANRDTADMIAFFDRFYEAGRDGRDMPRADIHPQDARAAYEAGRKDREAASQAPKAPQATPSKRQTAKQEADAARQRARDTIGAAEGMDTTGRSLDEQISDAIANAEALQKLIAQANDKTRADIDAIRQEAVDAARRGEPRDPPSRYGAVYRGVWERFYDEESRLNPAPINADKSEAASESPSEIPRGTSVARVEEGLEVTADGKIENRKRVTQLEVTEPAKPKKKPNQTAAAQQAGPDFSKNKIFTADKVAAARARMRSKLGQLNSGIDPEMLVDGMTIAGAYIESGVRNFTQYAKAMVEDLGDGVKPYLLSFWEGARNYPGLDTKGMTDPAESARQHQALLAPTDTATDAVGTVAEKPARRSRKTGARGDMVLTQDWGVEHIDGYGTSPDRETGNDTKDAFLKETRNYLNAVADSLRAFGYEPHMDRKGKPERPVSVNESGVAGSGDVTLTMHNPETGNNVYIHIGDSTLRGVVPTTPSGIAVMYRVGTGTDRYAAKAGNIWAPVDLSANDLAALVSSSARTEQNEARNEQPTDGAPDQGGAQAVRGGRGSDTQQGSAPADTGDVEARQPADGRATDQTEAAGRPGVRQPGEDVAPSGGAAQGRPAGNRRTRAGGARTPDAGTRAAGADGAEDATGSGRRDTAPVTSPAATSVQAQDLHIDNPLEIVGGTPVQRFNRNRAALELLQTLEEEGRQATPEEQRVLAGYIGWGSFGQELFQGTWDRPVYKDEGVWKERGEWLRETLGESAWKSAQRSITNAHYTDPPTVMAMWDMARRMGFTGGKVLEPSMGTGNFFSMMPADLKARSQLTGIELDETTGAIAKHLFPKSNIRVMGYEQSKTPDNFYDLVIGNWPFENTPIADRRYNKLNPMLHDYFFLKTLDQVRPGGLVIGITSAGSMDKQNTMIRREMARKAELVASIRLPSGAFEEYAGTKVVTDIVVLRKRPERLVAVPADATWVETGEFHTPSGNKVRVNQYYLNNPQNIIGQLDFGHGTTTFRAGMIVHRPDNMAERLRQAVELVPENAMQEAGQVDHLTYYANETGERHGALSIVNDQLMVAVGDQMVMANEKAKYELKDAKKTAEREKQLRDAVELRRLHTALVDTERRGEDAKAARRALKGAYEGFTAEHGPLRESFALKYLERIEDPFFAELAALENDDGTPSAVMTRSTTRSKRQIDNPSIRDAYVLARNQAITPSLDDIARIANKPAEEVRAELLDSGAVFETPAGDIVPSDIYLSGNVRQKLREAQAALAEGNAAMQANIDALQEVMPEDVPYFNIETKLGATWVPTDTYASYIAHMLGRSDTKGIEVSFRAGRWKVKLDHALNASAEASANYGTQHYSFSRLVQAALSNQVLRLRSRDSDGNEYYDAEKSEEVNSRLAKIREDFGTWLWSDPERRVDLEREYNESRNAWATPRYDGSFLTFEGMALSLGKGEFNLREHQANAIWRAIVNRRSLNAHEVGTGKTFTMGGIAIESRRYGIARKPVILAHNANSATVAKEIRMMYPSARVLYVDNLEPKNRDIRLRQIANDDWDAIVIPHSLIDRLALREETLMQMAADDIAALEAEFFDAAAEDGVDVSKVDLDDDEDIGKIRSVTAKELAKARKRIIESIKKQAQQASKEGAVTFEDLGIDMILVDEVHEFKKPPIVTRMQMKGLNTQVSSRSIALQFLTRYVRQMNNGGNVHTFTGTPITNTITEIYHQMRYVMETEMEQANVADWDGWFGSFATEVQDVELSAAGDYEMVTRLAGFVNVPELRQMVGQYMDTVFADDMPEMQPRKTKSGKQMGDDLTDAERAELLNGRTEGATDRPYKKVINESSDMTDEQLRIFRELQGYAQDWRNAQGKQRREWQREGDPRSPIITEGIANKASFDVRLLDESLAGMEGKTNDDPNSKASRVVANTLEIYNSHPLANQVIFAEMGFSKSIPRTRTVGDEKVRQTVKVFSTVHDIVERLVQGGIPREQIAIVDGKVNKEKRREIAEAMNDGRIRVVIGSTDTLGVGVNMQRNLRAMHHLDAPYMPGELEQRNGRGQRQGNQWNTVLEYRYMTDRLDGRRWQILAVKQRFITAFMKANSSTRVIEGEAAADEQSDILESFSEAAGDPRVLQRVRLQKKVESLQRKERLYTQGIADMRRQIRHSEREIEKLDTILKATDLEGVAALIESQRVSFSATIDGKSYDTRTEAIEALQSYVQENLRVGDEQRQIGVYAGHPMTIEWYGFSDYPTLKVRVGSTVFDGKGIAGVEASMRNLPRRVERMRDERATAEATVANMRQAMQQPFGQADDLARTVKQLEDLEADLEMNPVPPPAWLRQGAPIDSEVYRNKKPYIVTGHRYSAGGWFVIAEDAKGVNVIPYLEVTDNVGMPIYDEREFVAPEIHQGRDAAGSSSPEETGSGITQAVETVETDTGLAIAEDEGLYSGYDREASDIQSGERAPRVSEPKADDTGRGGRFDLFAPPGADARQAYADLFGTIVVPRAVARISSATDTITSEDDLAHLLASIRKDPQEAFYAIATGKGGKVLRVMRFTRGTKDAASVYPLDVVAEAASIAGIDSLHFAHNHPSGKAEPSRADTAITNKIQAMLDGTGIKPGYHVVIGHSEWGSVSSDWGRSGGPGGRIQPRARTKSIPVTERRFAKRGALGEAVTTPAAALRMTSNHDNAIFLLNTQHAPVGVIPMTPAEMRTLRDGGRVNRILSAINTSNASAAIVKSQSREAADNATRMLASYQDGIKILDAFYPDASMGGMIISAAERGSVDRSGPFFRLNESGDGSPITLADAVDAISAITLGWKPVTAKRLKTVATFADLPRQVQQDIKRDGGAENVKGFFHNGTAYVIAGNHTSIADLEATVFHEAYGHLGFSGLFGKDATKQMNLLYMAIGGSKGLVSLAERHGINLRGYAVRLTDLKDSGRIATDERNAIMMEELLAHLQQDNRPTVRRRAQEAWGAIRNWFRKYFPNLGKVTEAELFYLLKQARDAVARNAVDGSFYVRGQALFRRAGKHGSDRRPWGDFPGVIFQADLGKAKAHPRYGAAKGGDIEAAAEVVASVINDAAVKRIRAAIGDRKPRVVPAVAEEATGRNKLPVAYAHLLATRLGLEVDAEIVQAVRANHTDAGAFHRIAVQPVFDGPVEAGQEYLIVDDTMTMGGTLANLRGHIEANGGRVILASTLTGFDAASRIGVTEKMKNALLAKHGQALNDYLQTEFGFGIDSLTQGEAGHLRAAPSLDAIRDRLSAARSEAGLGETGQDEALGQTRFRQDGHPFTLSGTNPSDTSAIGRQAQAILARNWNGNPRESVAAAIHEAKATASRDVVDWLQTNEGRVGDGRTTLFRTADDAAPRAQRGIASAAIGQRLTKALKGKLADLKPAGLGALPLMYLRDFAPRNMTALDQYLDQKRAMDADRNEMHARYDAIAQKWLKSRIGDGVLLDKARRLVGLKPDEPHALDALMHDATIEGIDPSKERKPNADRVRYQMLRKRFEALSPEQQALFSEVRDAYKAQIKALEDTIEANIVKSAEFAKRRARRDRNAEIEQARDELTGDLLDEAIEAAEKRYIGRVRAAEAGSSSKALLLREKFESMRVDEPYFPLKRFGDYFVALRDGTKLVSFSMFETSAAMEAAAAELKERHPNLDVKVGRKSIKQDLQGAIDPAFVSDIQALVSKLPNAGEISDQVYQLYLDTLPDFSMRKGFIHRKKVDGYGQDAMRAFASTMFHSSHQIARLKHSLEMNELVEVIEEQAKQAADPVDAMTIANEVRRRHEWVMNPQGGKVAQAITSAAFVYQLGISPAAAFVNTTQTFMMGVPILGARFKSERKAISELLKASKDFVAGRGHLERTLKGDEKRAFHEFMRMGLIDKTQAHDLAGVGETGVEYSAVRHKVMGLISYLFHNAERYNREVTSMAAYRMGRADGLTHEQAMKEAAELTWMTHFDYSSGNRARYMQNDTAKVLLVFRQHSVNMLSRLAIDTRQALKGASPQIKAEARRRLAGIYGMFALMSGLMGVPGAQAVLMLLNALGGDDEDPWTVEDKIKRAVVEALGEDLASAFFKGVPGTLADLNLTDRIGMGHLWFFSPNRELEGRDAYMYWMEQALGAAPAMVANAFSGASLMSEGHVMRGFETMLPKAGKDLLRAVRYSKEGVQSLNGYAVVDDVSAWGVISQALGFMPAHIAEQYERNSALKNAEQRVLNERRSLMNRYALAIRTADDEARSELMIGIADFNRRYPTVAITGSTIAQSLKARAGGQNRAEGGVLVDKRLEFLRREQLSTAG